MDPITRDFYEERRRKWRRSAFWRGFLVATVLAGLVLAYQIFAHGQPTGRHIAYVNIVDVIYSDPDFEEMLRAIAESDGAEALIVRIDSPGGTVVGSEGLYLALQAVADADKPVVAVMGDVAASGGYIAAIAADHVIARGNTITGSIGVVFEYLTFAGLMDRVGVGLESIRSSELKAAASPFREMTPEARQTEREIVAETYAWFRDLVGTERGLEGAALDAVADGRSFTGRMALDAGLIDALGDDRTAIDWLESVRSGLGQLPIATWELPEEDPGVVGFLAKLAGFRGDFGSASLPEGPRLMSILK